MKRFILGVGAQKAGTTWLHDYLVSRDDVDMGFVKEYHIFDLKTLGECKNFKKKLDKAVIQNAKSNYEKWRNSAAVRRTEFIDYTDKYFDYFADVLSQDGINYTGDITPSYSGLRRKNLFLIRDEFAKRDIEVCPIFLMRDPVLRLRSAVNMHLRDKGKAVNKRQELAHMRKSCGNKGDNLRANYRRTVENLDQVFGHQVFYGFYETLFCNESLFAICDYLRMDRQPGIYNVRKNASPSKNKLSRTDLQPFIDHYKGQYYFCQKRFGAAKIEGLWRNY